MNIFDLSLFTSLSWMQRQWPFFVYFPSVECKYNDLSLFISLSWMQRQWPFFVYFSQLNAKTMTFLCLFLSVECKDNDLSLFISLSWMQRQWPFFVYFPQLNAKTMTFLCLFSSVECKDKLSKCPSYNGMCRDRIFGVMYRKMCPETCGECGTGKCEKFTGGGGRVG